MEIIVVLCLLSFAFNFNVTAEAPKNYGTFNLSITQFETCKGPKQVDCTTAVANINSYYSVLYEITVLKNVSPARSKVTAIANGKEFMRLQIKKTCDHLFMKPLLGALLNITDDCVVMKGQYRFTVDLQHIAKSYFAGTFLFGNWTFKAVFYNNECNFSCSVVNVLLTPIDKESVAST